jgi:hypothetical protein
MEIAHWISAVGLVIGAGMGLYAIIRPSWASWLVRLKADPERTGGFAEFRGTYGGLFFFTNAAALACLLDAQFGWSSEHISDGAVFAPGALMMVATMWWGTAVGRVISILADRQGLPFNLGSVAFELALGALVAAPLWTTML